jgi:hypothetical protein
LLDLAAALTALLRLLGAATLASRLGLGDLGISILKGLTAWSAATLLLAAIHRLLNFLAGHGQLAEVAALSSLESLSRLLHRVNLLLLTLVRALGSAGLLRVPVLNLLLPLR